MLIQNVFIHNKNGRQKQDVYIDKNGDIVEDIKLCDKSIIIDGEGMTLIPGLIDTHTHGYQGISNKDNREKLQTIAKNYARRGVLGFLMTCCVSGYQEALVIVENCKVAFGSEYEGARCLGIHLEGPHINPNKRGAIEHSDILPIDLCELDMFLKNAGGFVKMMTIAPEMPGATEAIRLLRQYGIRPSLGHTLASYDEAIVGINAGACGATHTYNAMKGLDHKRPSVLDAVLSDERVWCELISDCCHVSKTAMSVCLSMKGFDRVMAISDSNVYGGCGMADGETTEDGLIIHNGAVYLPDGVTLNGSTRDVYDHFITFVKEFGFSIYNVTKLTSKNAADFLGIKSGQIESGYTANLLLLDNDWQIKQVIIQGKQFQD